ncbi:13483_t:CDS:2, partial [Acaulospora morrowiae]
MKCFAIPISCCIYLPATVPLKRQTFLFGSPSEYGMGNTLWLHCTQLRNPYNGTPLNTINEAQNGTGGSTLSELKSPGLLVKVRT